MNDYFLYLLVIAVAVLAYMYKEEKKRHFTTQVELDLLKERKALDEINKELYEHPLGGRPIPPDMLDHVGAGTDTRGSDASGDAKVPKPPTVLTGL